MTTGSKSGALVASDAAQDFQSIHLGSFKSSRTTWVGSSGRAPRTRRLRIGIERFDSVVRYNDLVEDVCFF